jgi:hypothetical protein
VIGPFFLCGTHCDIDTYLDMLELFAVPQIGGNNVIF